MGTFFAKAVHHILVPVWQTFIYEGRGDRLRHPIHRRKIFSRLNQYLMENGYTPPWIITKQECLDFWRRITNDKKFVGNRPHDYAVKPPGIGQFFHQFWSPHITQQNSILELGCNCGTNLKYLQNLGYSILSGIEAMVCSGCA